MKGTTPWPPLIRFGGYELDTRTGDLRNGTSAIHLHRQPLQLLLLLLEHPQEVVCREELRAALWPNRTHVDFEDGLNHAIRRLREALGDSAEHPQFIETVPRLGYRFIEPVEVVAPAPSPTAVVGEVREPPLQKTRWPFFLFVIFGLVSVVFTIAWFAMHESPARPWERRLTANSSENVVTQGAISPDGKYLAYGDETGLHLKLIRNGDIINVPPPQQTAAKSPGVWWPNGWFPDGSRFVVVGAVPDQPPSAWVVSVLGEAPHKLRDNADVWSVSPDGMLIAFGTGRGFVGSREIWVMGPQGEGARRFLAGSEDDAFLWAVWSPVGRRIAYAKFHQTPEGLQCSIESRNLEGKLPTQILSDPRLCDLNIKYVWWPDGRFIYTMTEPEPRDSDNNLWEMRVETRAGAVVGKPRRLTDWAGVHVRHLGGTQDGKRLAISKTIQQVGVYVGELEANGHRLTNIRRLTLDQYNDFPGRWTPDSKAVLFVSDRNGTIDIFKQALDHSEAQLVVGGTDDKWRWMPTVSPDGSWILYMLVGAAQANGPTPIRIMRLPISGGAPEQVLEEPGINELACAQSSAIKCVFGEEIPEQAQIVISAFDPAHGRGENITRINLAVTQRQEDLTRVKRHRLNGGYDWDLSHDGKYLAFTQYNEREALIRILPVGGGKTREVTVEGRNSFQTLNWAPNGKGLFVATAGSTLLYVDLDGRAQVLWQRRPPENYYLGGVPSPDGRRLRITGLSIESNVWMLENF